MSFEAGQIVCLDMSELDKSKYFLVAVVTTEGPLLFYISSKIYNYALTRDYLWPFQIKLTKSQHSFMPNDISWMNCTEVCNSHNWISIDHQLRHRLGRICGLIHNEAKAKAAAAVQDPNNHSIADEHRDIIVGALS
jgi:hypothetical protein